MKRIVIGLHGAAGSGKDMLADYLVRRYGFTKIAFADPLYDMAAALLPHLGVRGDVLRLLREDRAFKESPLPLIQHSPRHLLQTLGTEWGRVQMHPELWLRIAQQRIALTAGPVVLTDVRFANEAALVLRQGGAVWRLLRPSAGTSSAHTSETPLARDLIDHHLHNDGTPEQLFEAADGALAADFPDHTTP